MPAEAKVFIHNKVYGKHVAGKFVSYIPNFRKLTAHKIKTFNQIHFLLFASCNLISKYFSFQLLLFVLITAFQGIVITVKVSDPNVLSSSLALLIFLGANFLFVSSIAHTFNEIKYEVRKHSVVKPILRFYIFKET